VNLVGNYSPVLPKQKYDVHPANFSEYCAILLNFTHMRFKVQKFTGSDFQAADFQDLENLNSMILKNAFCNNQALNKNLELDHVVLFLKMCIVLVLLFQGQMFYYFQNLLFFKINDIFKIVYYTLPDNQ
jgi:hypothetical protein